MNLQVKDTFWDNIKNVGKAHIHVIVIATKPDIIKQYPIYVELKKQKESVILVHTGQHYDFNLSGGMLEEFGLEVDVHLGIQGAYHQKMAQIIERIGDLFAEIKACGKTPIPYVHGDTMTAMTASCAAWANQVACVHVEAGIRTLGLKKPFYQDLIAGKYSFDQWRQLHLDKNNFEGGQIEPYPEQYNTRATEPASGLYLAPVQLAADNLVQEGFRVDRIKVVGNSVADATMEALKEAQNSKIFEKFPQIQNGFIRFCIHRRENCGNRARFTAIFESMEELVKKGETILLISLFATEKAVDDFALRPRLESLKQFPNFVYSEVWPFYGDVIAAMMRAQVCVTDSGSMQEEMNILGIPTVTLRFGSDRPESFFTGGNVIAPPVQSSVISNLVLGAKNCEAMRHVGNIYGENVSEKCVKAVLEVIGRGEELFEFYTI